MIRDKQPSEVIEAAQKEKNELIKNSTNQRAAQVDSRLAQIFSRDAEKAVEVIENCLKENFNNEEDINMYIINIHSMKSALANIGERELSAIALRLEQAGRENNINVMLTETQYFIDDLRLTIDKIKPRYNGSGEDTEDNLILLREELLIIKEACSSFDKKTAKNALNKLLEMSWSANTNDLLNTIAEHLLHSEFDVVIAIVSSQFEND
jgi:HPt (histidine-containing phosphotransfer) domain-containing protein